MKQPYHIDLNPEDPSPSQIEKHKDFAALMKRVEVEKKEKKTRFVRLILPYAAAAAIAAICLMVGLSQIEGTTDAQLRAEAPYVHPPLPAVQKKLASFAPAYSQTGQTYITPKGSKITVPESAFQNADGTTVVGEVNIEYKEFGDFVDIFLSGIPMEYDSAGVDYQLLSAGMIEITASQNGKMVFLKPGKKLQIELQGAIPSPAFVNQPPNFNIYRLDEDQRNWAYTGKDQIQFVDDAEWVNIHGEMLPPSLLLSPDYKDFLAPLSQQIALVSEALAKEKVSSKNTMNLPELVKPVQPAKSNGRNKVFDFRAEGVQIPELAPYTEVMWEVDGEDPNYEIATADDAVWQEMDIQKVNNLDYQLTLKDETRTVSMKVRPVLSAEEYIKAQSVYQALLKAYEEDVAKRVYDANTTVSEQEVELGKELQQLKAKFAQKVQALINRKQDDWVYRKVINRFEVDALGIWNCDRPVLKTDRAVKGSFKNSKQEKLKNKRVFMANSRQNTLYQFYSVADAKVHLSKHGAQLLWSIEDDGHIAVYKPSDFDKIPDTREAHTFHLKETADAMVNEEMVREVLLFEEI